MPDDFREFIEPVHSSGPLDPVQRGSDRPPAPPARRAIHGTVHGVRRGKTHKDGQHRLDVSVGGDGATELIIRVPAGTYTGIEGKRVVIYVDE